MIPLSYSLLQPTLEGNSAALQLPTDLPKTPATPFQVGYHPFVISDDLVRLLEQQTQADDVTPQFQLIAAFHALLYRYTQQEVITIQLAIVPEADRNDALPTLSTVLSEMNAALTMRDLWHRVTITPGMEGITYAVGMTCLDHSNLNGMMAELSKVLATQPSILNNSFDLHLVLQFAEHTISGIWIYNTNLFMPETIQRLTGHFLTILKEALTNLDCPIGQLPLLTTAEHHQLVVEWNQNAASYPQIPLYRLIESHAAQTPDAIAITFRDQSLTYAELNQQANQLAHYLQQAGVKVGDRVAVCLPPSLHIGTVLLGIFKAGGVYVPLDPTHPTERLAVILDDTQAKVVLTESQLLANLPATLAQIMCCDRDWETVTTFPCHNLVSNPDLDQVAYIIYTSGTTGKPKGVMASHRNLINYILATQERLGFNSTDVMPAVARFTFSISLFELLSPLAAGGTLFVLEREHILDFPRLTQTLEQLTMLHTVPSLMQKLVNYIKESKIDVQKLEGVRHVFTGGDIVPPDLLEALKEVFPNARVAVLYGCSEVSSLCATFPVPRDRTLTKSRVGKPFNNVMIRLYDVNQNLVPIGIPGEIYVGGAGVTIGYLNREDLTQEKFVVIDGQRFYRTGDLGRFGADGNLEFLGRADFQIKLRGIRIELGDIESTLRKAPGVRDGVVAAQDLGSGEKSLVGYVVLDPTQTATHSQSSTIATIRQHLTAQLPDYMVPTAFMVLDALPLNHNQKVDRRALPVPTSSTLIRETTIVPPSNAIEQRLVQVWEEVLAVRPLGIENNFFELGGSSLLAVQMLNQIELEFGKNLSIASLVQSPTVKALAQLLTQQQNESGGVELIPLRSGGSKPPLFCIYGVFLYKELADCLPDDRPVYGVYLQEEVNLLKQGADALENTAFKTVPDIATRYLQVIRTLQPHGPYHLLGESFGGVIAFEMAQQLQAVGEEVAFVGLLDSYAPNYQHQQSMLKRLQRKVKRLQGHGKLFLQQGIPYLLEKTRKHPSASSSEDGEVQDVRGEFRENASRSYFPTPYAGKLVLFRAMERHPSEQVFDIVTRDLGWQGLATASLEIFDVPGDHLGILKSPNVQVMAEQLQACLDAELDASAQSSARNHSQESGQKEMAIDSLLDRLIPSDTFLDNPLALPGAIAASKSFSSSLVPLILWSIPLASILMTWLSH